jgi:hypothetical protein
LCQPLSHSFVPRQCAALFVQHNAAKGKGKTKSTLRCAMSLLALCFY